MRVLIADASNFMIYRLQHMLVSLWNVEVVGSFHNGTDALTAMHKLKTDLAVFNNKLRGLVGVDFIKEIIKENNKVKIINTLKTKVGNLVM